MDGCSLHFSDTISNQTCDILPKGATRAEELAGMKHAAVHHWAFSLIVYTGFLIGITLL